MPAKTSKAPAKAPKPSAGGGKSAKKKKWSKGKAKEKLNNLVLFDKATYDKLLKEVPQYKLITVSILSERLKITGSLAAKAIRELKNKGLIKPVNPSAKQMIYTRNPPAVDKDAKDGKKEEPAAEAPKDAKAKPAAKGKGAAKPKAAEEEEKKEEEK